MLKMTEFKTNEIYEFIAVEKRYDELLTKIDNACRTFCERNIQKGDGEMFNYSGWDFNERYTLIEITYSYTEHCEIRFGYEYVSFEEIISIMNENEPKIKQIRND